MRPKSFLWPLLVALVSLAVTGWLWRHEQQTQERHLRDNFEFGLRQSAARIEQRMAGYEQMLRGARGLFEASEEVTRQDFASYVDTLLAGADFAGLRSISYAPLVAGEDIDGHVARQRSDGVPDYTVHPPGRRDWMAPLTYIAPAIGSSRAMLGNDPLSEPMRRRTLLRARDAGSAVITDRLVPLQGAEADADAIFLMVMPVYARGLPSDSIVARRAHLRGWVIASFRVADMMSSLYGEGTPGLDVSVHDGVAIGPQTLMYGPDGTAAKRRPHFEAQEYIGFGGHTWTLSVRSRPGFEQRYGNDSAPIILVAGSAFSLLLALLTWQLSTARERANAAARLMTRQLRDSAEGYRRIVETANEGIWTVDADGIVSFSNPKLQQLLGCDAGMLLGRPWADFMDAADRQALEAPGPQQREVALRRADGSRLWALLATSAITDPDGRPAGVLAMVTDLSERKRAEAERAVLEEQLRQSQKMEAIGTLAGGIAHDFNNILAAVLGNVSLLQEQLGAGHPASARLAQIGTASERARSLVQQIVAFSRQQPQALRVQPLRPLLEEAVTLLRSTLPAGVELETRLADTPLHVQADATQLQQVLMNLCTNAWHALKDGRGQIVIGLETVEPGPRAHLWVSDNGIGMDEATRQRVFEPFFTTKPVGQGTGLGLSVVHGIVSSHQGQITVSSQPGAGSCFDLYFPLAGAPLAEAAAPAAAPAAPGGQGERVLYIDDDPVMAAMVEGLLQRSGYRVTCLTDPLQARQRLRDDPQAFDVVVTDFNMPELSGLELAREATRLRPDLPVIMTSGYVSDALRADVARAGVRHVMQKEFTLEQLAGLVHRALTEGR